MRGRRTRVYPLVTVERLCDDLHIATTILIVDDHPAFRRSARRLLEGEGFDVVADDHRRVLAVLTYLRAS